MRITRGDLSITLDTLKQINKNCKRRKRPSYLPTPSTIIYISGAIEEINRLKQISDRQQKKQSMFDWVREK